PDDVTPTAIQKTGAEIITYGAPVLPGAMFLLAYKGEIPILGLPGCVMYSRTTIFDLVLPRICANEKLSFADFAAYGHGGLCNECEECKYPDCAFGKGV
ncbi:MAG: molybdopterin-binding protein, partial [Clostridiaceae bacterium]|nr:molybdopterin-binding protein [Clostridiaceae bacterium]